MAGTVPGTTSVVEWAASLTDPGRTNWFTLKEVVTTNVVGMTTDVPMFLRVRGTPMDLSSGLLAHYKLDGDAHDATGNGGDGVISGGVTFVAGRIGQAASFNGVDGFLEVTNTSAFSFSNESFSVSLWVQFVDNAPETYYHVLDLYKTENNTFHFAKNRGNVVDGRVENWLGDGGDSSGTTGSGILSLADGNALPKNTWIHMVSVVDVAADELRFYMKVHGKDDEPQLQGTRNLIDDFWLGPSKLRFYIGGRPLNPTGGLHQPHKGLIDDVRIYDRALSLDEILLLGVPE